MDCLKINLTSLRGQLVGEKLIWHVLIHNAGGVSVATDHNTASGGVEESGAFTIYG